MTKLCKTSDQDELLPAEAVELATASQSDKPPELRDTTEFSRVQTDPEPRPRPETYDDGVARRRTVTSPTTASRMTDFAAIMKGFMDKQEKRDERVLI